MKKMMTCLMLASLSVTVFAASSFENAKNTFSTKGAVVTYSEVSSVQPGIITDAECARVFGSRTFSTGGFSDYHSDLLDITDRKVLYKAINSDSTAIFMSSTDTLKLQNHKVLKTPKLISTVLNNKTLEDEGIFVSYFCRGKIHGQRVTD